MRIAVVLPGLHRVNRGAETAFESIGREIAQRTGWRVTLFGSGNARSGEPYEFIHVPCTPRERFERWLRIPVFRSPEAWEEWTFLCQLRERYDPTAFDAVLTCSYPFCNWFFQRKRKGLLPVQVYVTQNGDWPCFRQNSEYRWFNCDHLVCTNPDFFDRHRKSFPSTLIPNGVDPTVFCESGQRNRSAFNLPLDQPVGLVVSALIPSKRVVEAVEAASKVDNLFMVVAGDGPLRATLEARANELMPNRFRRISVPRAQMPELYRCADLLLHMSMDEPSANAYMEAMATGLPIVTHRRRVTEWTLGSTAYLTDASDTTLVAAALRKAISECAPIKRKARIQRVQEQFTWSMIAQQYCDVIRTAVSRREAFAR